VPIVLSMHGDMPTYSTERAQSAVKGGNGTEATALWGALEEGLSNATDAVDWYNVLLHHVPDDAAAANGLIEGAGERACPGNASAGLASVQA